MLSYLCLKLICFSLAVDVVVINIIGIDNASKTVYGVGNNKISYMKYIPNKGKWYSISRDHWERAKPKLSDKEFVTIEDSDADSTEPLVNKRKDITNGEKWGGRMIYRQLEYCGKVRWLTYFPT